MGVLGLALLPSACSDGVLKQVPDTSLYPDQGSSEAHTPPAECIPSSRRCLGDNTPQLCAPSGTWSNLQAPCPFLCQDGACVGTCIPQTKSCNGNVPQACDANGQIVAGAACPNVCVKGVCAASCQAGTQQCSNLIPQTCGADGKFQDGAACTYVCQDGACVGVCTPGTKKCSGNVPQSCDAHGQLVNGTPCPYGCSGGNCKPAPAKDSGVPVPGKEASVTRDAATPPSDLGSITGTIYYVANNGLDSNGGTIDKPFKTIQKAANTVKAGENVMIRGGVYHERITISVSGTSSLPVKILAYPGETPAIDGGATIADKTPFYDCQMTVSGSYVQLSGLEIRASKGMGLCITGTYCVASHLNVHDNMEQGLFLGDSGTKSPPAGSYGLVQNCEVWRNAARNQPSITPYAGGGWACALCSAHKNITNVILRGNRSHDNWGEGISTWESTGTIIEDNIAYNNHSNIYVSDSTNILVQRNLVYMTANPIVTNGSNVGIQMGDEQCTPSASHDITVINNLVYGTNRNVLWWKGCNTGMKNVVISNNTLVNSVGSAGIELDSGAHQNVTVENNIVVQDNSLPVAEIDSISGVSLSHNLWSKSAPSNARSATDVVGDPKLAKSGTLAAGQLTGDWFKLLSGSLAIDKARALPIVTVDFFKKPRGAAPDIGGHEF
jgi:parallel beta-helix repeat protein